MNNPEYKPNNLPKIVKLPLTAKVIAGLRTGDSVRLSGVMYTARDAAHKRMVEALEKGLPLPFEVKGQTNYQLPHGYLCTAPDGSRVEGDDRKRTTLPTCFRCYQNE